MLQTSFCDETEHHLQDEVPDTDYAPRHEGVSFFTLPLNGGQMSDSRPIPFILEERG